MEQAEVLLNVNFVLRQKYVSNDVSTRQASHDIAVEPKCKAHRCWGQWFYPLFQIKSFEIQDRFAEMLLAIGGGILLFIIYIGI